MSQPAIGLISHGTSSPEGRRAIAALASAVADDLHERGIAGEVMLGHVDVQHPNVAEVLSRLPVDGPVVLVPLLLSPGYHVHVDLTEAVREAREGTENHDIRLAATLGPDRRLARILADRLPPLTADDEVVLAAAGSSDERANEACLRAADDLAQVLSRPVTAGFHAGEGDRLEYIVEQKISTGSRVVVSNYLLAPGFFEDLTQKIVAGTGGGLARPLLHQDAQAASLLVDIVRDRILTVL